MAFKLFSLFGSGGKPQVKTGAVAAAQTGAVFTITPQLDPSATLSLTSASNSNLTLSGSTISASAALGAGVTQIAYVRETLGSAAAFVAQEYAVALSSPAAAPAAPSLIASSGNAQVTIAWTDGAANGSAIQSHNLYRSTTSGNEVFITNITAASPYTDTGLTNGQAYFYRLSAVNGVGEGALSAEVSATPSAWILGNGAWNDSAPWDDTQTWKDAA